MRLFGTFIPTNIMLIGYTLEYVNVVVHRVTFQNRTPESSTAGFFSEQTTLCGFRFNKDHFLFGASLEAGPQRA